MSNNIQVGDYVRVASQGFVSGRHIEEGLSAGRVYRVTHLYGSGSDHFGCVKLEGIPTPCVAGCLRKDEFLTAVRAAALSKPNQPKEGKS